VASSLCLGGEAQNTIPEALSLCSTIEASPRACAWKRWTLMAYRPGTTFLRRCPPSLSRKRSKRRPRKTRYLSRRSGREGEVVVGMEGDLQRGVGRGGEERLCGSGCKFTCVVGSFHAIQSIRVKWSRPENRRVCKAPSTIFFIVDAELQWIRFNTKYSCEVESAR
jgi:hypothetical protein